MRITIHLRYFILLYLCTTAVFAQEINQQTRQKEELERQISLIDKQLDSTQAQQQATLRNLNLLQQKVTSRKSLIAEIGNQVNQLTDSIKKKEKEIGFLHEERKRVEASYLKLLYTAYTHRNRQVWMVYILASDNLRQAYRRWQYFKDFSRYLSHQTAQMKRVSVLLDDELSALQKMRKETEVLKGESQKELTILNQEERETKSMMTKLSGQERTLRAQLQQKQRELTTINREIGRIMAEAEKNRSTANAKETESNKTLATNFEQNKGKLPWPLNGVITEPYGQHNHPVLKGIKMPFNNGVGISGNRNDEIRAVFQGVVKQIVLLPGYSQCVLIQHGSYYTFYCKLGAVKVKVGDTVAAGDVLGSLAEIDKTYSLHFELWRGTEKQNPELWLRKR